MLEDDLKHATPVFQYIFILNLAG